ncbi:sensor histidine kinase [Planomonospora sp. ID91781]|uniref:sensor histidine kinase n=1 Tax=Planomonospora sp. ID91781 TaxID=2738135 RepID=UPI0018C38311|nr:histidine kinase [Planomonospora sp. ID91781]MBG0819693.1 sensor histidine kinase [Planomonospora sp. ID91781]
MGLTVRWRDRFAGRRVVDAAVVLVCLALTGLAAKAHWSALPWPVIVGAGVPGSLAQWWRRRWPQAATVAGAAAYALSGNPAPLIVGLYSGAAYAPRRQVWALAVAGWAGFAGWSWIDEGRLTVDGVVQAAAAAALVTALGLHVATRRALAESWRERAESAEAERRLRDEQARSAERTRIAREMHDVLAHKVSLIALHAGALELAAGGGSPRIEEGAALIRVTAREALQELRYVLGVLRAEPGLPDAPHRPVPPGTRHAAHPPDAGASGGYEGHEGHEGHGEYGEHAGYDGYDGYDGEPFADLSSLVRASERAGQRVELHDRAGPLPPVTARVVYRVVQEGLTNAHKHAPDAPVTVSVDRDGVGAVTVAVDNPPASGAPADLPGSGSGLVGLAERVRLVGGTLHGGPVGLEEGGGWRLRAVLPHLDHGVREGVPAGGATEMTGMTDASGTTGRYAS